MTTQPNAFVSLSNVLDKAIELGSTSAYDIFKEAILADSEVKKHLTIVPQSANRTIYLMPAEIGYAFAERFAKASPSRKSTATSPAQMELELPMAPNPDIELLNKHVDIMQAKLDLMYGALGVMSDKVDKLLAMWETLEDDHK